MEMERQLYEAAMDGDVETIHRLILMDPLILERVSLSSADGTPLHIAASRGHSEYVRAICSQNPELAAELDSLGRSPLHLASAEGRVGVVRELLRVNPEACLVRDKDGRIPLHLAVLEGKVEAVSELARACPESARVRLDVRDRGGSALHLCVKRDCLEALKVLVEYDDLLNLKDDDGNTIFHLAALFKRSEITEYLLSRSDVELSAVNENGFTALDLIENSPTRDFETLKLLNILLESGARRAKDLNLPLNTSLSGTNSTLENSPPPKSAADNADDDGNGLEQMRGALILTASIIAAATFITPENWDETNFFSTSAISLVLSLSIVLLLFSGCPLDNEFCAWILMALMYTTLYSMAWNFTSTIGEFEDLGSFLVPLLLVLFVFFPLLGLVALARTIKLIKQAPRKLREFVNGRSRPTTRSLAAA
ncbi:hypothetical protein Nepgr_023878 [Nepenthes gracilis]|uniref:Uncharacterized protein n=1 Tax=Nepenthes gracilis TaxID=150966 RepID=A0AAD3XZI4_NEPGR|nr:hypothetical protein Nepgr_023878 [Nepenthes gracilis]